MNKPIKIAYLIDTISSDLAGTEKQLLEIIRRLDKDVFEPHLICLYSSEWLEENTLPCSLHVLGYNGLTKIGIFKVIRELKNIINEQHINIVQTFFVDSIFVGYLAAIFGDFKPVLLSSRGDIGLGQDDLWYHTLFKTVQPLINRRFDGIVANSQKVKEYVAKTERIPLEKIMVIHNGIDTQIEDNSIPEVFNNKAELWIGITANLRPIKRIDIFLKALALLKRDSKINFHAIVLGEGPHKEALKALTHELGLSTIVHYMGSVKNVYSYLKYLDIGVLCSDREGLSNAIMEYMASGLPVVSTAVGGNTELIDSENGILVPVGDVHALGSALLALAESPKLRERLGRVSLTRIKEQYAWDRIINKWGNYYHSIVFRTF